MERREFLKRGAMASLIVGTATTGLMRPSEASQVNKVGTVIDLSKCDGCIGEEMPKCVAACRVKNQERYPEPVEHILPYWPQKKYEDWQDKKGLISRLTPYNWTFVQKAQVDIAGQKIEVFIPRRCMHCDNPPCAKLCPFAANEKTAEGPVVIDPNLCMGGAKCRDACPWEVPQRQAGVGLYLKIAPKFAGGGVMYKCDLCLDLVKGGKEPACVPACPQKAMSFGTKEEMTQLANKRAKEISGFVYGNQENGGTGTFYVSQIPFEKIEEALKKQEKSYLLKPGVANPLESAENLVKAVLLAPVAGIFAGGIAAWKTMQGGRKND